MNYIFSLTLIALSGYLIGGLNPAYGLSRLNGFDIRSRGSGNAGASNAMITMGKKVGIVCALFDIFKAYLTVKICMKMYPTIKIAGIFAGGFCILGHIFPIFMHFHGGKGLATLGGVILAFDAKIFLIILLIELVIVLITKYICFVPISASAIFTLILQLKCGALFVAVFLPVVLVIFARHKQNLKRMKYGLEVRVSYLWNRNREATRIKDNFTRLSYDEKLLFPEVAAEYDMLLSS